MKVSSVKFQIPIPPSDNRYYGKPRGSRHKYLTKAGKEFRDMVAAIVYDKGYRDLFGDDDVAVKVVLHLPAGGDIWNRLKAVGDALEHSKLINDDKQIADSRVVRGHRVAGGRCELSVWRL